jgi:hypothetical protein
VLRQAAKFVRAGKLRKAMAALQQAEMVEADEAPLEALRATHPQAPAPIEGISQENLALPTIPGPQAAMILRSPTRGSGAGPSG